MSQDPKMVLSHSHRKKRRKQRHNQCRNVDDDGRHDSHARRQPAAPSTTVGKIDRQKKHEEALALSQQLRLLSSQKRMQECLNLYRASSNDELRDAHHGSIVIDCCARCGDANEAERVVNEMLLVSRSKQTSSSSSSSSANKKSLHEKQRTGHRQPHYFWEEYNRFSYKYVPIQAWTALLKGYAHLGMMEKADSLFHHLAHNMIAPGGTKRKRDGNENGPNVRTLNTLLRGCLWTATSLTLFDGNKDYIDNNMLVGGVMTAERAWSLCEKVNICVDSSSYEYLITLLSQSLRLNDAERCLKKMKVHFSISVCSKVDDNDELDRTILESLVVCLVTISRGYALLGKEIDGQRCTEEALRYLQTLDSISTNTSGTASAVSNDAYPTKRLATGGKKAWKENVTISNPRYNNESTGRRDESNKLFRNHRLSELRSEASLLRKLCSPSHDLSTKNASYVAKFMLTRLLYFSGGGATGKETASASNSNPAMVNIEETTQQWIQSLWTSFGLKEIVHRLFKDGDHSLMKLFSLSSQKMQELPSILSADICIQLRAHSAGRDSSIMSGDSGRINFAKVFTSLKDEERYPLKRKPQQNKKIHIELGAGAGDWACLQAQLNPSDNYVTVELRADRVAQTFAKSLLHQQQTTDGASMNIPLANICCVGSDCGSFLRDRVEKGVIKTIFVNHPEPPTQTYNDANATSAEEPAHMLNSQTILSAARCLEPLGRGRLIIVTDNLIYARFICHNLARMISGGELNLLGLCHGEVRELTQLESFGCHSPINLYEGKPSKSIGHFIPNNLESGTSYFDRLWRTGAGKHADMRKRYIICLKTSGGDQQVRPNAFSSVGEKRDVPQQNEEGRSEKKKGADKQRRRNERRLLKKQLDSRLS